MIELRLSPQKFEEIIKKGYNLDIMFLLKMMNTGELCSMEIAKIASLEQTIIRKGLATIDGKLTPEGEELLKFLSSDEEVKIPKKKRSIAPIVEDGFVKWWRTYPATDTFKYKGKEFIGTRALRVKKSDCEAKINKILASGEYKIEELIDALKLEISQKVENSIKTGQNKMSYFQNSLTYLNQATYDPYVELVRAGHKPKEDTKTVETNETFI